MARISTKDTLAALVRQSRPKLTIIGSAIATKGRAHVMMKVRPSTLRRLYKVAFGPTYWFWGHALVELIEKLEKLSPIESYNVAAATRRRSIRHRR